MYFATDDIHSIYTHSLGKYTKNLTIFALKNKNYIFNINLHQTKKTMTSCDAIVLGSATRVLVVVEPLQKVGGAAAANDNVFVCAGCELQF